MVNGGVIAFTLALLCAAVMGLAIQRGGTCTVAAVEDLLAGGEQRRLLAIVEASLWVGVGLLVVRELTGGLRERFNQWVAVRHRNRVRDHLAAMEQSHGEGGMEELIGALLGRAVRSLGLERVIPLGPNLGEHSLDR